MPLVATRDIIEPARSHGIGVGAFNVLHLETAEALVQASMNTGLPVILQISQNCVKYHGELAPLALSALELARTATTPIAVHLDHAEQFDLIQEAIALGFGSVMFDGASLPYDANITNTREVVDFAHQRGVYVEAELGEIGGKDGAHAPGVRTDPEQARAFVAATGVDALAVAVGSSHAMTERTATLDLQLISQIRSSLEVPLVLHGSSGVPDDALQAAIAAGMTKINVSTHLNSVFTGAVRERLAKEPALVDSRKYISDGRAAIITEAGRLLRLFAVNDQRGEPG